MNSQLVTFKGSRSGLYINLSEEPSFGRLLQELENRLRSAHGFFRGSEAVVDIGKRVLTSEQLIVLEQKLSNIGGFKLTQVVHEQPRESLENSRSSDEARLVRGTLHSGQTIRHDGHVVVMGDINPGAEAIATGDILVVGKLRGVVHAGAGGDTNATVVAFRLQPIQLRIADIISRSPGGGESKDLSVPEMAFLQEGIIVVQEYGVSDISQRMIGG